MSPASSSWNRKIHFSWNTDAKKGSGPSERTAIAPPGTTVVCSSPATRRACRTTPLSSSSRKYIAACSRASSAKSVSTWSSRDTGSDIRPGIRSTARAPPGRQVGRRRPDVVAEDQRRRPPAHAPEQDPQVALHPRDTPAVQRGDVPAALPLGQQRRGTHRQVDDGGPPGRRRHQHLREPPPPRRAAADHEQLRVLGLGDPRRHRRPAAAEALRTSGRRHHRRERQGVTRRAVVRDTVEKVRLREFVSTRLRHGLDRLTRHGSSPSEKCSPPARSGVCRAGERITRRTPSPAALSHAYRTSGKRGSCGLQPALPRCAQRRDDVFAQHTGPMSARGSPVVDPRSGGQHAPCCDYGVCRSSPA